MQNSSSISVKEVVFEFDTIKKVKFVEVQQKAAPGTDPVTESRELTASKFDGRPHKDLRDAYKEVLPFIPDFLGLDWEDYPLDVSRRLTLNQVSIFDLPITLRKLTPDFIEVSFMPFPDVETKWIEAKIQTGSMQYSDGYEQFKDKAKILLEEVSYYAAGEKSEAFAQTSLFESEEYRVTIVK